MQEQVAGLRRFGAAALDLAWVAAGRLDGYWERDLKPWDMAAGLILVREAGGFVTDCDGGDDMFGQGAYRRRQRGHPEGAAARAERRPASALRPHRNLNSIRRFILWFRHDCFFLVTGLCHIAVAESGPALTLRTRMAKELDPLKLSSPRIFLFRMLVFVVLGGLVAFLLYKQIQVAFMANPGLNAADHRACWSSASCWRCAR